MVDWADVLEANGATPATVRRLVAQLRACEAAAIAFCRLLERWGKGDAHPATPGARRAAFRHAADRVETALAGLETPLSAYLIELEPDRAEGSSWYGGPGAGELVEWRPVLERAGVTACPSSYARSRGSMTRSASTSCPTAPRCGRGSSTCGTRFSAQRSTTFAR